MMPRVLHILTKPSDSLSEEMIDLQEDAGNALEEVDLTVAVPDYNILLQKIFEADSIESW